VLLHRTARHHELGGDARVRPALGHQRQHLPFPRGQRAQPAALPAGAEQLADHLGVERGAAVGDPLQRGGELGHVGDAVLEQVADAGRAALQQLRAVGRLDVLREDQHAGAGELLPQGERGAQALVGVRGRHADVHDRDVRPVRRHRGQQPVAVRHRRADRMPPVLEQPGQPLPQQRGILRDHDLHGK
jgi:hypothetical protein